MYFVLNKFFGPDHLDWQKIQSYFGKPGQGRHFRPETLVDFFECQGHTITRTEIIRNQFKLSMHSGKVFAEDDFRQLVLDHGPKKSTQNVTGSIDIEAVRIYSTLHRQFA